jgi:signal transduction histidine kinase
MTTLLFEQLEDRLAALHYASLELIQDISLESLLERIPILACEQVHAKYAAMGVLNDNGQLVQFLPVGITAEEILKIPHLPQGFGLIGELYKSDKIIRIADISADPRHVGFPPGHPVMKSFLGVPIQLFGRQLGQIYLTDKIGADEFTAEDETVIVTLAAYAAVAISNARLYEELRHRDLAITRRNEDLALLNDLASTLASSLDIDEILDKTLSLVMNYLSVQTGEIFLREEDGHTLKLVLHRGDEATPIWTRDQFELGIGLIGKTAQDGQPIVATISEKGLRFVRKNFLKAGFGQLICIPLTGRSGMVGVLCVAIQKQKPSDEREIQLLTAIGSWAGTAIENARLHYQGRRLAVLEERERIGMDLHDGIIQSIYAVGLTLEHARLLMMDNTAQSRLRIDQAISDLNNTIRDIRAYILDLRPRKLHEENLMDGLQHLVNEFRSSSQIEVNLKNSAEKLSSLKSDQAIALFHICQEALANIAKHAQAHRAEIFLWDSPNRVLIEIRDDGKGFDMDKANLKLGHGLLNMQTRARNVDGDVEITSEINNGTTILAWVPIIKNP